jgi:hypothetical protein
MDGLACRHNARLGEHSTFMMAFVETGFARECDRYSLAGFFFVQGSVCPFTRRRVFYAHRVPLAYGPSWHVTNDVRSLVNQEQYHKRQRRG